MIFSEFEQSLQEKSPPNEISEILEALWHDAKNDWEAAHEIAQRQEGQQSYDLIHGYLHRKEGDDWNANYWYRKANTSMPQMSLHEEWILLVNQELTS